MDHIDYVLYALKDRAEGSPKLAATALTRVEELAKRMDARGSKPGPWVYWDAWSAAPRHNGWALKLTAPDPSLPETMNKVTALDAIIDIVHEGKEPRLRLHVTWHPPLTLGRRDDNTWEAGAPLRWAHDPGSTSPYVAAHVSGFREMQITEAIVACLNMWLPHAPPP
ncbi:MAG: hypothetical protein AAGI01_14830 [Myxococcota bacterium]